MSATLPIGPLTIDSDATEYWDRVRNGTHCVEQCSLCGHRRYPPRSHCPKCLSPESIWVETSRLATVYSYIIYHQAFSPALKEHLPYNAAIVELDDGPRMWTNVIGLSSQDELHVGLRVELILDSDGERTVPRFRPINGIEHHDAKEVTA